MKMFRTALVLSLVVALVHGYPTGPPIMDNTSTVCQDMFPKGHNGGNPTVQTSAIPYELKLSVDCYKGGDTVQIWMVPTGMTYPYFEGWMTQVQKGQSNMTTTNYGTFAATEDVYSKAYTCFGNTDSVIAHKNKTHFTGRVFEWTAPATSELAEDVYFRSTIVKNEKTFWVDHFQLLKYDINCVNVANITGASNTAETEDHGNDKTGLASTTSSPITALISAFIVLVVAVVLP